MSLFRKPKKNIQRRVFSENTEDEESVEGSEKVYTIKSESKRDDKTKIKQKSSNKSEFKKQSLLSFDDNEEGEVFQVKKSSYSKKMMRMYEKERKKKEAKELKIGDEVKPTVRDSYREVVTDDLVVVVNHNVPSPPPPPILSGRDALCAGKNDLSSDEGEADIGDSSHRFSKPDNFKRVLESGAIPDAAMIHAARKKRQRARELGDYIPVGDEEEPEDKGRLARDEEHDDASASDDERINMGANPVKRDQERRREQFYDAQDQESDQELDEWEDQQIRKGVTGTVLNPELYQDCNGAYSNAGNAQKVVIPTKIEPGVPRTPDTILEKLREQFKSAQSQRQKHAEQVVQVQRDLLAAAEELETLKLSAPKAAEKFRFYQELRGYITDLVECLDEKVAVITGIEQRTLEMMARRSEWFIERRRQDVRDQADEATSLGKKVLGQKTGDDSEKMRRAVEREGRRTRRRRARESTGDSSLRHVEGMSTDDEMPQQCSLQFDTEREQLQADAAMVFDDVIDEFSSIANILIHFEHWRETDMMAYQETYATLCLPKVVSPLVRLHILFWDPLNDTADLEKADWYRTLALYGLHDDETETSLANDPDLNLLPTIFEKVVMPKVVQVVEKCWDPLSSAQTLKLVGIVSRYVRKFPTLGPDSKPLNNLFNVVLQKLTQSLEHDVFIPIMPRFAETKNPFFQRQFASGLKLLRNITCWQGLLNDSKLKELAITCLLNRYLISAIRICKLTDAVAKAQLVSLILPRVWLASERTHLQMFTNCILSLAQQIDKENPLHLESSEILSGILKTVK